MPAKTLKRSVSIAGHRTSVSLEPEFWRALGDIAADQKRPLATLIGEVDKREGRGQNLSSALRVYVLAYYRKKI